MADALDFSGKVALVTGSASVQALADAALDRWGQMDVLVNNAGIFDKYAPLLDTDEALWDRIVDSKLKAPFLLTRALLPQVIERGGGFTIQ